MLKQQFMNEEGVCCCSTLKQWRQTGLELVQEQLRALLEKGPQAYS